MAVTLNPFIMLDGQAREAIRFYEQALDAKLLFMQTLGEAPPESVGAPLPDEAKERLAHSVLQVGDTSLFVSDTLPGQAQQNGNQINICITTDDAGKSARLFEALRQGGRVNIPLEATYFSPAYGMVTDPFGVVFQIFTKRPA